MPENDRSFAPNTAQANRAGARGQGVGQEEMDLQRDPGRDTYATDPQRTEPFDQSLPPTTNADRPMQADFTGQEPGDAPGEALDDRGAAGQAAAGDLGASTPAGVDVHDLGQGDNPEEDWGEEADEGATFSSTNTRRGVRTEADRGQGAKTRAHTKDIISRRS